MVYLTHTIPVGDGAPRWLMSISNATGFGVPVFFTLSAYLITELLTTEKQRTGTVNTKAFYVRRILRIWPLYFFMLGMGFIVSRLHPGWAIPIPGLIAYLLLVGNWYTVFHGYLSAGIEHLWSIPVEEQFYLIWPFLVLFVATRKLGIICGMAWILSQCALIYLCHGHADLDPTIWTNSLVHLQYFALGAGLSVFLKGLSPAIHNYGRLAIIFSALMLFFLADFVFDLQQPGEVSSMGHTYPEFLCVGLATTLLLFGFLGYSALKEQRSLRYLGKISYGLYIYHLPCLLVLGKIIPRVLKTGSPLAVALIGFPLSVAIAAISYRYLETPFLRMKERFEIVKSRAV